MLQNCRSARSNIHAISKVRSLLSKENTVCLVNALVTSRFDYCNSLSGGATQTLLKPIQLLQNKAARVVSLTRKRNHITPVLRSLHWLPIKQRVNFKILCLTYKALNGSAPIYLKRLLVPHTNSRFTLRSCDCSLLVIPRVKSKWGARSFSHMAPRLWNHIPLHIRLSNSIVSFKKSLKTYLFNVQSFPPNILI